LRELLKLAEIPRSTFYYNLKNMKKEDKYKVEKDEIYLYLMKIKDVMVIEE
jgi:hypothetical protein